MWSFPFVHSFSVASYILTPTDEVTTLGVILDSKLIFNAHVSAVCKNVIFIFMHYIISGLPSLIIWPLPLPLP